MPGWGGMLVVVYSRPIGCEASAKSAAKDQIETWARESGFDVAGGAETIAWFDALSPTSGPFTLMPTSRRYPAMLWAVCESCRNRPLGVAIVTSMPIAPACCSSCLALFGSYGYGPVLQ